MRVLVSCEMSGNVRRAFRDRGIQAWSNDIYPAMDDGQHIRGDALEVIEWGCWDMVIAFPPCDHLAVSGARWFAEKRRDGRQQAGIDFFMAFTRLNCLWAIENPVGIMSTRYRKPDQIIQPWQFGHGETKATCLWLNGLPLLQPTAVVEGREARVHRMPPGPDRARLRGVTYPGIAEAMAGQWSRFTRNPPG